jgi:NAD(P)-dependent dehydrogenase (short-subunit alcohol dehydrogenase family)
MHFARWTPQSEYISTTVRPLEREDRTMPQESSKDPVGSVLIIGASRGLGHAMASEFAKKGWRVVGTVLEPDRTQLHDLADEFKGRIQIEPLDMCVPDQIAAMHKRLVGRSFDILFVNAGIAGKLEDTVADTSTEDFVRMMVTNALSPMRVIESFEDLVSSAGTIGVMSSGQGSVSGNDTGGSEVYRSTKAALNMFMRSYAARHAGESRSLVCMAPGWTRTALGGPNAPLGIDEVIPKVVDVILSQHGTPGLKYLDRFGHTVPW